MVFKSGKNNGECSVMNPFKIKKGLGRGLSSLIGDTEITKSQSKLSISSIVRNKYQPRKIFDKESLEDLTASIKERGIIQPIIVRKTDSIDKFEIVAGETVSYTHLTLPTNREV